MAKYGLLEICLKEEKGNEWKERRHIELTKKLLKQNMNFSYNMNLKFSTLISQLTTKSVQNSIRTLKVFGGSQKLVARKIPSGSVGIL